MSPAAMHKDKVKEFLSSLMGEYRIVAPVREQEKLLFKVIENVQEIEITDEIPYKSPKEFLFPQLQKLMTFDDKGNLIVHDEVQKTVIFGVKPCDLETIKILTAVFTEGKYADAYFARNLENTIFIGTGCVSKKPGCFCSDRGIQKEHSSACDVFLADNGEHYRIEFFSDAGRSLFKEWNEDTSDLSVQSRDTQEEKPGQTADHILEIQADESRVFHDIDWDKITEKCLGCGICTYICPTCHCFAFKDIQEKGGSTRYRTWDSCMYPKFTLHASGHNPRAAKKERFRQRVMHKYVYMKENLGYTGCTGCGRCIRSCPAGMSIKSVVSQIMEELK